MVRHIKIRCSVILGCFIILTILSPNVSFAHPGRTDSSGCHTCRTNCPSWGLSYGEYHCHRSKGLPQSKEPIKSHLNKSGAGYTEPAPEYKTPNKVESSQISKQVEKVQEGWFTKFLKIFGF